MLSGSVDPRRPEKQQRYKPPPASNNAAPGEDLTPDYMNILDLQRKSMQRSDRFKVVKIESTEPFKRGRWECMDFLDQSYNRVFQRNNVSTVSELETGMLQIFYRQNTQENVLQDEKRTQTHVLRPGMVSASLVGIKLPFESNFEEKRPATVSDCHMHCDNQKLQSMSSDYSNLPVYTSNAPQEQIITYVDQLNLPFATNYTKSQPAIAQSAQTAQNAQNAQNPQSAQNDAPEILYQTPRFEEYETKNEQLSSVISYDNLSANDNYRQLERDLKPVFDNFPNQNIQNIVTLDQNPGPSYSQLQDGCQIQDFSHPQDMTSCVKTFLTEETNLVVCDSQNLTPQSIDDKIEKLVDLVSKHLKYAILEDVNDLKQQILNLKRRVAQLEYENALLRSFDNEDKYKRRYL